MLEQQRAPCQHKGSVGEFFSCADQESSVGLRCEAFHQTELALHVIVAAILKDEEHRIRLARDSNEVLKAIEERRPHLVVTVAQIVAAMSTHGNE